MQKINIEFSKHRTNGFILDFLIKSLEVFQKNDSKTYQRFLNEDEISAQEYHDTQDTIISDILFTFFDSFKNKDYKYYEKLINEFFKFYNLYKLNNETLATSQKQLDFITIINVFIPFINRLLKYKIELSLIDSILPDEKENTIQKLFKLLKSTFIKFALFEFFKFTLFIFKSLKTKASFLNNSSFRVILLSIIFKSTLS